MNLRSRRCLAAALIVLFVPLLLAADWPRFRGPNGSAVSETAQNLPVKWSGEDGLAWKVALPGPGSSSPIVVGDKIFLTCYTGYSQEGGSPAELKRHLLCLNLKDGSTVWKATLDKGPEVDRLSGYLAEHGYASSTPVSDGKHVYVFYGKSGVLAYDMQGKQVWQTSVGTGSAMRNWGSAVSPILYKNTVIVNANAESEKIVALDKLTGKEVWSAKAGGAYGSWATPIVANNLSGKPELLINVPYEVWALNPDNGKLLWYAEATQAGPVNPSLVENKGVVYAVGSRGGPFVAIKTGGDDDAKANVLWSVRSTSSYVPSPLFYRGHLYLVNDNGVAYCVDPKSGKELYSERLRGVGGRNGVYASVVAGDGKVYAVSRRSGTFVMAAGPEYKLLSHNKFDGDDTDFNASPAIIDGKILLRSNRFLYCVGAKSNDSK